MVSETCCKLHCNSDLHVPLTHVLVDQHNCDVNPIGEAPEGILDVTDSCICVGEEDDVSSLSCNRYIVLLT